MSLLFQTWILGVPSTSGAKIWQNSDTDETERSSNLPVCTGSLQQTRQQEWLFLAIHCKTITSYRRTWGPRGGWTKAKVHMSLETWWDFDMLNTYCPEQLCSTMVGLRKLLLSWSLGTPLAGFHPWPSASNTASKCPGSLAGRGDSREKSLCRTQTCPPLAEARVNSR